MDKIRLNKIVKIHKFLGLTFYERERISEHKLEFEFETIYCEDIGLYVIGKYPRLKYSSTRYNEDFNWQRHAISTLRLTILNLINKDVIEIVKVEDKASYIYKSFPKKRIDYIFKVSDLQIDEDWFSQLVYKTINEVNLINHPDLFQYVRAIIDKVIYAQSTYGDPSRAFLINILRKYIKAFPWIKLDTKSQYLGLLENHSLKVAEIYIPRLNMQHQSLSELENDLIRNHKDYAHFCKYLRFEIERDFKRRKHNRS